MTTSCPHPDPGDRFREVPFVPLANGTMAKFADGPVVELDGAEDFLQYPFSSSLRVVSPQLSQLLASMPAAHVIFLRIGMTRVHPVNLFIERIGGLLCAESTKTSDLVGLLQVRPSLPLALASHVACSGPACRCALRREARKGLTDSPTTCPSA